MWLFCADVAHPIKQISYFYYILLKKNVSVHHHLHHILQQTKSIHPTFQQHPKLSLRFLFLDLHFISFLVT